MAALRHLGFGMTLTDHVPQFDGPPKIARRSCLYFIFGPFDFKLPIHAPLWGVFGEYYPK